MIFYERTIDEHGGKIIKSPTQVDQTCLHDVKTHLPWIDVSVREAVTRFDEGRE